MKHTAGGVESDVNNIKKLFKDVLIRNFDAEQMESVALDLDRSFNMLEETGFGSHIPIPRQVAADCLLRYFADEEEFFKLMGIVFAEDEGFYHGSHVRVFFREDILRLTERHHWLYDEQLRRFKRDQRIAQSADWGFMREGEEYQLCFASIDIAGNSALVRNNVKIDVENTYSKLRTYVRRNVEAYDGRIWYWLGDGGLAVFRDYEGIRNSMLAMIAALSFLPVFNLCENELRPEDDIRLRVGISFGKAAWRADTSKIASEDIARAEDLEKNHATPGAIVTNGVVYQLLPHELRRYMTQTGASDGQPTYRYEVLQG